MAITGLVLVSMRTGLGGKTVLELGVDGALGDGGSFLLFVRVSFALGFACGFILCSSLMGLFFIVYFAGCVISGYQVVDE